MQERGSKYPRALTEFQELASSSNELRKRAHEIGGDAWIKYRELEEAREEMLEAILEKKGLAVCSNWFGHELDGRTEEEKLGLFPKSEMRLLYQAVTSTVGGHGYEHLERKPILLLLCPSHFTEKPNEVRRSTYPDQRELDITSEVVEKNGRLVILVNSIEIDLSVEKHYAESIYRHFGLPELPEHPK